MISIKFVCSLLICTVANEKAVEFFTLQGMLNLYKLEMTYYFYMYFNLKKNTSSLNITQV